MKNLTLTLTILLLSKFLFAQPLSSLVIQDYIEKYKDIAIEEMKRTGVPAAITLAQGILETEAGTSRLVLASNNHFGIKCKSTWRGEWVTHDDDAKGECFRKYSCAEDSYKDHSDFLRNGSRYAFLFQLDPTDCEGWAAGLKKAGYATNPRYPQILMKYINDYALLDYTLIALGRKVPDRDAYWVKNNTTNPPVPPVVSTAVVEAKKPSYPQGEFKINETEVVFAAKGTSFLSIAETYHIRLSRLFEFNDMLPQDETTDDQLIYLRRKRKTGANEFHTVAIGENLYQIAQAEGIRFESLLAYNHLQGDVQPQAGEVLYLHKKAPSMPRLATSTAVVTMVSNSSDLAKVNQSLPVIEETTTAVTATNSNSQTFIVHIVQPKETMYSISKRYAVSMDDVLKWNDLQSMNLKTGQQLRIKKM